MLRFPGIPSFQRFRVSLLFDSSRRQVCREERSIDMRSLRLAHGAKLLHLETNASMREASLRPARLSHPFLSLLQQKATEGKLSGGQVGDGKKIIPRLRNGSHTECSGKYERSWNPRGKSCEAGMSWSCHLGLHILPLAAGMVGSEVLPRALRIFWPQSPLYFQYLALWVSRAWTSSD